jgi:hypothetical protein
MISLHSIVAFKNPMIDEFFKDGTPLTFIIIEIDQASDWCRLAANVDMNLKPTQNANISDLTFVIDKDWDAEIDGVKYPFNIDCNHVLFNDEWCESIDEESEEIPYTCYIVVKGKKHFITVHQNY